MKFLKKGLAVLFACTFVSVPLYHPVKADAVSMDDMGDMNEDQEVSVSDAVEILTIYAKSAAGQSPSVTERKDLLQMSIMMSKSRWKMQFMC